MSTMISVAPKTTINNANTNTNNGNSNNNSNNTPRRNSSISSNNTRRNSNITPSNNKDKDITKIVLSKQWILPPRPKPGRKPSEDIPNSKRKAQNRAAQRAFRERRANRVSELEDKILIMERDRVIKEGILNNEIKKLKNENSNLLKKIDNLVNKLNIKENEISLNNKDNELIDELINLESQGTVPLKRKISSIDSNGSTNSVKEIDFTNAFPFKKQRKMPSLNNLFLTNDDKLNNYSNNNVSANILLTSVSLSNTNSTTNSIVNNNYNSSNSILNSNRNSTSSSISFINNNNSNNASCSTKINSNTNSNRNSIPFESCGFCSDDTPCVCKEIENAKREEEKNLEEERKIRVNKEIEKKEKELILELTKDYNNKDLNEISKCTGNPGSCLQCKNDPLSTLFCQTIAKKSNEENIEISNLNSSTSNTSTTGTTSNSINSINSINNIKLPPPNINNNKNISLPSIDSLKLEFPPKQYIPVGNAYKTITNHLNMNVNQFRNNINNITNNLNTKGMFVEVDSVVSYLRDNEEK